MNVKEMSLPMPKNGKPMTEQEYIQTCTTEQLAEWLRGVYWHCHEDVPLSVICVDATIFNNATIERYY